MSVDLDLAPIDNTDDHTEKPDAPKKRLCQGVIPEAIWFAFGQSHVYQLYIKKAVTKYCYCCYSDVE